MISDLLSGIKYFFQGFKLVTRPELRRFVIAPLIINIIVFTGAIIVAVNQFNDLLAWLLPQGPGWWAELVQTVLWVFFAAIVLLILFFSFTILANLLGAPFNGLLSEKVEGYLSGETLNDSGGFRGFISTILPSIKSELRKILYFLITALLILLTMLIPGVQVIAPFLWALFTSWMLALEYTAYPMENHKIYFSQVRSHLKKHKLLAFGFGTAVMIASSIPVVNFIVVPAAVAGATAMWVNRLKTGIN
ncbi:MAG: sulfate transporter CysZ [Nitrospirota bacterium]